MGTLSFIKRIMRRPYARENMSVGYPKLVYSHLFLAEPGSLLPSLSLSLSWTATAVAIRLLFYESRFPPVCFEVSLFACLG